MNPLRDNSYPPAQYIQADDVDDEDIPGFNPDEVASPLPQLDKGKGRAVDPTTPLSGNIGSGSRASPNVSGNIGASGRPERRTVGGVRVETRYSGVDTLDEPVTTTIARDLKSIYTKLIQVLYPRRATGREVLRDWDLWGPFLLCLFLGITLSVNAPPSQSLGVFTGVVTIIALGSLAVTVQAKLLGGRVSFFQGLCTLGYCLAPLDAAALISCFARAIYVRVPVALIAWAWCVWAAVNFLDGTKIEPQRILLAVYPLLMFYFILTWMILIL